MLEDLAEVLMYMWEKDGNASFYNLLAKPELLDLVKGSQQFDKLANPCGRDLHGMTDLLVGALMTVSVCY